MPWTAKLNQGITLTKAQPQPQPKISKYEENPKKTTIKIVNKFSIQGERFVTQKIQAKNEIQ